MGSRCLEQLSQGMEGTTSVLLAPTSHIAHIARSATLTGASKSPQRPVASGLSWPSTPTPRVLWSRAAPEAAMFQFDGSGSGVHSRFPTGPGGMLLSGNGVKGAKKWAAAAERVSIAEAVVGLLLIILSYSYLYQFTSMTGLLLGALLVVAGLLGYFGAHSRNASLENLQLIVSIVGVLLAFNFIGNVVRDTQTDCALSELYMEIRQTRSLAESARQGETMQAVFSRLNEMEDLLSLAEHSALKKVELKQAQEQLKMNDLAYLQAKIEMIEQHANQVLESVLKNPNITSETITAMSEEDKSVLRQRLALADDVLAKIKKHHSAEEPLTPEDFEQILNALTALPDKAGHVELTQSKQELPNFKAAMDRAASDSYHTLAVGEAHSQLQNIEAYRSQRRQEFESQFREALLKAQTYGGDYVKDLPEWCVKESTAERMAVFLGAAVILLQSLAAYFSLSLSLKLAVKGE